jgi:hypothetical protein
MCPCRVQLYSFELRVQIHLLGQWHLHWYNVEQFQSKKTHFQRFQQHRVRKELKLAFSHDYERVQSGAKNLI